MFPTDSDARPGRGISQGSRGLKTYTPPPSTQTAPGAAQGVQRSATPSPQQAGPATAASQAGRPAAAAAAGQTSRFGTGFMAGLLGAGLFGALLGAGVFGNLSGLLPILGLILQVVLIGGLAYLAMSFFRSRRQATASGPDASNAMSREAMQPRTADRGPERSAYQAGPAQSPAGGSRIGSRIAGNAAGATAPLTIEPEDFTAFERLLSVVQTAYGREDLGALKSAATPEMVGYLQEELEGNARDGVRNELGEPKLLQGDLSEAWSEPSGEYATVAMRYALTDAMIDRKTGKVVDGSRTEPQEATELWTFVRREGAGPAAWRLSAIQQVA
ncbi:MAG: TIM44-like domain-containing protein [Hyphomicrobiaceae bacterium]|nr:TIM44-like domain-containing protein [Hyphomicrobiaceae bacterium]